MEEAAVEGTNILVSVIVWIIIGGVAGWIASLILRRRRSGLAANVVLGVLGAVVAGWLFPFLGLGFGGGIIGSILAAIFGAVVVLLIVGLVRRA